MPLELIMGSHRKMIVFNLISSPRHHVILGLSWLVTHNPIVDWRRQFLDFTTRMGKANNNLQVVHDISTSPGQVELEDDHPAQVATTVEPSKYREFSDVFEKWNVDRLPEHRSYDCPIDIHDSACPPFGPMYGLSEPELDALRAYIDKNLVKGFIRHSKSLAEAPMAPCVLRT